MYRILIADDEEDIREGLASLIRRRAPRWEVIATARDGREALEQAKRCLPDAVLTDISMPHMNGLDLLENLQGILPDAKLLVLSGYDQFEYALQALRLGVSDYLLKPLESEKLLEVLDRLAEEIGQRNQRWTQTAYLRSRDEKARRLELAAYFRAALRGSPLPELPQDLDAFARGSAFCCVLCNGLGGRTELLDDLLQQRLDREIRKVLLAVEPPGELGIVLWAPEEIREESKPELFLNLNHILYAIANHCKRFENLELRFFIGSFADTPKGLRHSYRRSLKARNYAFPEHADSVTAYKDVLENSLLPCPALPQRFQRNIPTAVRCGSVASFEEDTRALFAWFSQEGIRDATYMRMCVLSLCYAILEECRCYEELSYFEFANFQNEIMSAASLEELQTHFENFVHLRWPNSQSQQPPRPSIASRVEEIIRQHLHNMDFSLDDVAAQLYISPNYLRQLFKQETGQTFTEFLTAQRMEHAHLLLGNPQMRISDAAEQCGYADSRYFSVCFKKYWHMTPSEYQAAAAADAAANKNR